MHKNQHDSWNIDCHFLRRAKLLVTQQSDIPITLSKRLKYLKSPACNRSHARKTLISRK